MTFSVVEHNGRYLKLGSSHWNPLISLYIDHAISSIVFNRKRVILKDMRVSK